MEKRLLTYGLGGPNINAELHLACLPILDLPFEIQLCENLKKLA